MAVRVQAQLEAPGRTSGREECKSLGRRRCHLVVCKTSKWETSAKEKMSILAPMQKREVSTYSSGACNSRVTRNRNPALATGPLAPLPLPTIAPSSDLFLRPWGIWSCCLRAAGTATRSFPGASRIPNPLVGIHPPGPEEDRQQHLFEIKCLD